jgi:hypothetical protein
MITREEYIQARQKRMLSTDMLYEYYLDNEEPEEGKELMTRPLFDQAFPVFLMKHQMEQDVILRNVTMFFDSKFNIHILSDKLGQYMKIW